jgi:hypothetical protein
VVARDQGNPPQESTAAVIVTVTRNIYSPRFINPQLYQEVVAETFTPSLTVITVTATDDDPEVDGCLVISFLELMLKLVW